MSDSKLRELERCWLMSGAVEDETRLLQARRRVGQLTESQLYTAAYLSHEAARGFLISPDDGGMYGGFNDHIAGICPCGDCRWDEGPDRWIDGLLGWAQNLPFPGIDDLHAEQEMKIRIGRALAEAVWKRQYTASEPLGEYVIADMLAEQFLEERSEEAQAACRELWNDPNWGTETAVWAHQVLYYVFHATGSDNLKVWFRLSANWLGDCMSCGTLFINPDGITVAVSCQACEIDNLNQAREIVEKALIPWVLGQ